MKAEVVYLFAFDVAGEIATGQIQSILSEKPLPFELRTDHTYPRDVPLYKPLVVKPALTAFDGVNIVKFWLVAKRDLAELSYALFRRSISRPNSSNSPRSLKLSFLSHFGSA